MRTVWERTYLECGRTRATMRVQKQRSLRTRSCVPYAVFHPEPASAQRVGETEMSQGQGASGRQVLKVARPRAKLESYDTRGRPPFSFSSSHRPPSGILFGMDERSDD
jgi:hypothetical protein